jgi:intracellular septation protein A
MHFLAAATQSTADRLKGIPADVWLKLAAGVAALIVVVIVLRKLAKMNRVLLAAIVIVGLSIFGLSWVYNRDEPAWATPVVERIAEFFPSKGKGSR